jgi:predicted RNase H-like nuclease
MSTIAGIDGCGSQWLAIAHEPGSTNFVAKLYETQELQVQPWALAAIDIPIGLPDKGPREADIAARKFIGPRRNSVFPCPIRPALTANSWREGCEITFAHDGRRISQQTFAILPKIREVDECIRSANLQQRFFEIHPEVSFAAWNGGWLQHAKKNASGEEQRRMLIAKHFGTNAFADVESQVRQRGVATDDIGDAFAALWSANRLFSGSAQRLPNHQTKDTYGLPMNIWY